VLFDNQNKRNRTSLISPIDEKRRQHIGIFNIKKDVVWNIRTSVTMLNLLHSLINLVLTEDQSDRPISDLEVEMSEATNIRVYYLHIIKTKGIVPH
jgi:hypothetical protein